jgi:hypothetical protein
MQNTKKRYCGFRHLPNRLVSAGRSFQDAPSNQLDIMITASEMALFKDGNFISNA